MVASDRLLLLSLLGALALGPRGSPASADPPPAPAGAAPGSVEEGASQLLVVVASKDLDGLRAEVAHSPHDPWLLVDELLRRGAHDAAGAVARAAAGPDVAALPGYVAAQRDASERTALRAALAAGALSAAQNRWQEALELLGPAPPDPVTDVTHVLWHFVHGVAQGKLGQLREGAQELMATAQAAEKLGWLRRAAVAYEAAFLAARDGGGLAPACDALDQLVDVCGRREDRRASAHALLERGNLERRLGRVAQAGASYEAALAAFTSLNDEAGAASAEAAQGRLALDHGESAVALARFERARAAFVRTGQRRAAAVTLESIAGVHRLQGASQRALSELEEVLAELVALGDVAAAAHTRTNVAALQLDLGEASLAAEMLERSLAELMALKLTAVTGYAHRLLGEVGLRLGEYGSAEEHVRTSMRIYQQNGEPFGANEALRTLGVIAHARGNLSGALDTFTRAHEGYVALDDPTGAAISLADIGAIHVARGELAKGVSLLENACATLETSGAQAPLVTILNNLGAAYSGLGDTARAQATYERVLAAARAMHRPASTASALHNLGVVAQKLGDLDRARAHLEQAGAIQESLGDRPGLADSLTTLGSVLRAQGEHARALEILDRALALRHALGDRWGLSKTLDMIGDVRFSQGRYEAALDTYREVLDGAEEVGDSGGAIRALEAITILQLRRRDSAAALEAAKHGMRLLPLVLASLGDEEGSASRERTASLLAMGVQAAYMQGDVSSAARFLETSRAGSLREALGARSAVRAALVAPESAERESAAQAAEAQAARRYRRALASGDAAQRSARRRELDAARTALLLAFERVEGEARSASDLVHLQVDELSTVRQRLGPGDAFVTFLILEETSVALVATSTDARVVALPAGPRIQAACDALAAAIALRADTQGTARAATALHELVVEPLAIPTQARRLLVSPDGALCFVPPALLLPDREVSYVPSATVHGVLREMAAQHGTGVLALGDPDYEGLADPRAMELHVGRGGGRLQRLPHSAMEARAIGTDVLLAGQATERGLRDAVAARERWHAVHLACHGLINTERPSFSALALTPGGDDDGFLTLLEVLRSRIPADLVVLSACETGKGRLVRGDGLLGLTRAFMIAGAPRVVCSLWKVDDQATSTLMTKFYELWNPPAGQPGVPAAQALRRAQEFVRGHDRWREPYYWAAWVLWGVPD